MPSKEVCYLHTRIY